MCELAWWITRFGFNMDITDREPGATILGGGGGTVGRLLVSPLCGMCCQPIYDRYIMRVLDTSYHERCLQCAVCGDRLSHTCFARDSQLYCRLDYDRLYGKKCLGCSERVGPEELVMRASDCVFHVRCFTCVVCTGRLQKGDQFVIKQGQLFCRPDYEKEVEMFQSYAQGDFLCDEILHPTRAQDGRRGPKRPRTILTTQQRRAFKASFEVSPKPCRKVREALAKETGLSVRIVQVWFQNQRAKMKKIQKKARLDNKHGKDADNEEEKGQKLKVKEEEHSPVGLSSFLNDSCSDSEATGGDPDGFVRRTMPRAEYLSIKEDPDLVQDALFKSTTDSSTQKGQDHQHYRAHQADKMDSTFLEFPYSGPGADSLHPPVFMTAPHSSALNPIDRLYSMQNSYFCSEEIRHIDQ